MNLPPRAFDRSLVGGFVRTANKLRKLHEDFGTRAYRVFLVWLQWSGKVRGEGVPVAIRETELRPTPRVPDETTIRRVYASGGVEREGDVLLDQIGLPEPGKEGAPDATTAELLRGEAGWPDGRIPPNVEFVYELRSTAPGAATLRFQLASEPKRDHGKVQWIVWLRHRQPDSRRDGRTAEVTW